MELTHPMPGQRLAYVDFAGSDYEDDVLSMDVPLDLANVVTSLVDVPVSTDLLDLLAQPTLHKIVLDIDHHVHIRPDEDRPGYTVITINWCVGVKGAARIYSALSEAGVEVAYVSVAGQRHRPGGGGKTAIAVRHKAWAVESSTPGHFHLYVDAVVHHGPYIAILNQLAEAGILQEGYVGASIDEGHTCVRLPWIRKDRAA